MANNATLSELLLADIPPALVRQLLDVLPGVYAKAHDNVHKNPDLGEPEAKYLLGHMRRALFETQFREIARACGIRVSMHTPTNGGVEHVQIVCGRFRLITCHVQSPCAFPQHSDCREQYAGVNEHVSQADWLAVPSEPGKESIFGVLAHTAERHEPRSFRCAQFGVPNTTFDAWVDKPVDLLDLRDMQITAYQSKDDLQERNQDVQPKWKRRQDDDKDAEQPGDDR